MPEDIYISYAYIDDQPLAEGLMGWVETFHEFLRIRIQQLTGWPVSIWRDRKLQGNDIIAGTLMEPLSDATVFVAVLSLHYVRSEWCLRELAEIFKAAEAGGGLTVGGKSRVFKVVKSYIPLEEQPPQLRGILGYEFFEYDAERGRAREFSTEVTPARDFRYWEKLDELAHDIRQVLWAAPDSAVEKEMPDSAVEIVHPIAMPPTTFTATDSNGTDESVFFCYDRDDTEFALKLATRLKERGVRIWLDQWDIPESADWDKSIDEALYGCSRFLIVLSPASVVSDEVRAELRIALDEKKAIFPILYQKCMVPRRLRLIQHFDFTARAPDDETMTERLVRSLTTGKR